MMSLINPKEDSTDGFSI